MHLNTYINTSNTHFLIILIHHTNTNASNTFKYNFLRCRHKAKVVVKFHQREFVSLRISQVIKQFFTSSVRNCNKGEKEVCSPTPWFHFFLWEDHLVFHRRRHFLITPLRRRKANGSFNGDDFSVTIKLPVTKKFQTKNRSSF